jgi:hypothetical protein
MALPCRKCAYDLSGLRADARGWITCPECGLDQIHPFLLTTPPLKSDLWIAAGASLTAPLFILLVGFQETDRWGQLSIRTTAAPVSLIAGGIIGAVCGWIIARGRRVKGHVAARAARTTAICAGVGSLAATGGAIVVVIVLWMVTGGRLI